MKKSKTKTAPAADSYFTLKEPLRYEGTRYKPSAKRPLGYRWYDPDRKVLGKRMEDQLRFAVCYWHSFVWEGGDAFGGETFKRPWHAAGGDPMAQAHLKADTAFELFRLLRAPYFTFHDRDIAPEGATLRESNLNVRHRTCRAATRPTCQPKWRPS